MANDNYEDVEVFFKNGLYIPQRIICIDDEKEINGSVASQVIKGISVLNSLDDKLPIRLYIHNLGGEEYSGYAIIDAIQSSISPVQGWVFGSAMSMAAFIFQTCSVRYMLRNSVLMFHAGTYSVTSDAKDVKPWTQENDRILQDLKKLLLKRMKQKNKSKTMKDVDKIMSTDTILTAKQALKLGFTDKVI